MKKLCFLLTILFVVLVQLAMGCSTKKIKIVNFFQTQILSLEGSRVERKNIATDATKYLLGTNEIFKFHIEITTQEVHQEGDRTYYGDKQSKIFKMSEVVIEYDQDLFEIYSDAQTGIIFIKALVICDESPLTVKVVYNGKEYSHKYLIWVRD